MTVCYFGDHSSACYDAFKITFPNSVLPNIKVRHY